MAIDSQRLIELAAAIRMTCSNPQVMHHVGSRPLIVHFDESPRAREFSRGRDCLQEVAEKTNLRPPLVFSRKVSAVEVAESLAGHVQSTQAMPNVVAVEGVGIFTVGRSMAEAMRYNRCLQQSRRSRMGSEQEAGMHQRLPGHVAIITGAAQGFGKGIAEELAREGAHVVVADLNAQVGRATRDELVKAFGEGSAIFQHCDVTDPASLAALVAETFRAYGGIDMLVANAGVLRAGGLEEMDVEAFRFVTRVNYEAFFLCVKALTPALKLQHTFNPSHQTDIVQVNSKSGLQGSNRNFAYAGSKFGGIGLVQSFALELVGSNVKVNAICPGNYFEGPLWADPKKGLFVQYLNTGKVPGAKTIEDVKRSYTDKVPMKRGCMPRDVARAILYVHDQEYETGQAIPVTGGQVMLS
jgi:sorbitol-6-phosphate 2-dehydrogenase